MNYETSNLLGPLHVEDEMIITKPTNTLNGTGCVLTMDKVDESKALGVGRKV